MNKVKFTVIDAIIIIALLAVIVVGVNIITGGNKPEGVTKEVTFTVLAGGSEEGVSKVVEIGEEVGISFSEEAYATVVAVEEKPFKEAQYISGKGYYLTHEIAGKSDVKVTLKCEADITDTKIANGNVPIRVGEYTPICGKGYTILGYIIEVNDN